MVNEWLHIILLGVVEGLTEFLPISSTGHLILLIDLLKFQAPEGKIFEIVIQLGAILAVCCLFRQRIIELIRQVLCGGIVLIRQRHMNALLPSQQSAFHMAMVIMLGFLPAMVLGVMFHDIIKELLFSPKVVCTMLVIGGIVIIAVERMHITPRYTQIENFSFKLALMIGLCQALAMIPGTSRSGATIIGALLLKVERKAAAEFSFFLAIPTMLAATCYDLYKNADVLTADNLGVIAVGFSAAFITAMVVVRWLMHFISTHGFTLFGYYRIVLGVVMFALL